MTESPFTCTDHGQMAITQSGLQHVCVSLDCDQHVRAHGPRKEDKSVSPKDQPLATVSNPKDKKDRERAIAEAAEKVKARAKATPPAPPKPETTKKSEKPKKEVVEDADMLSVSDVARELGLDPKRARAKLRAGGQAATEGRWPKVKRGSKKHDELIAALKPSDEDDEETDDDEDDE